MEGEQRGRLQADRRKDRVQGGEVGLGRSVEQDPGQAGVLGECEKVGVMWAEGTTESRQEETRVERWVEVLKVRLRSLYLTPGAVRAMEGRA